MATLITYPGVAIEDVTQITPNVVPYGLALMLISANSGNPKEVTSVTSLADFQAKFGQNSPSEKYVKAFFDNADIGVNLAVYRVNPNSGDPASDPTSVTVERPFSPGFNLGFGSGTTVTGTPETPVLADWLEAPLRIDPTFNPGGIILAPEAYETVTEQGRASLSANLEKFCSADQSYWIGFIDIPDSVTTVSAAIADLPSVDKGDLAVFYPSYTNLQDVSLLPSAAMAAIGLSVWKSGSFSLPIAGTNRTIKNCKNLNQSILASDYQKSHDAGLNLIRYFAGYGFCPYDNRTLSKLDPYYQITSVVCFKVVKFRLTYALTSLVFSPIQNEISERAQSEAAIAGILRNAYISGLLIGETAEDAYRVNKIESVVSPSKAIIKYLIEVRPAFSVIRYIIEIENVSEII